MGDHGTAIMPVSGSWVGEYAYESDGGRPSVPFALTLRQQWLVRVSGVVVDGAGGMPEQGKIVGWLLGKRLRFQKLMPIARVVAEEGTRTLREALAFKGHPMIADTVHPPILYEGVLSDDGLGLIGTWRVEDFAVPLADGKRFARYPAYSGSWTAKRTG
jgi:hypothetical protein